MYLVEGGEQSHREGSKKAGQPQGKHGRYIDANSGLARGIYTGGERGRALSSRKARAKGFLLPDLGALLKYYRD